MYSSTHLPYSTHSAAFSPDLALKSLSFQSDQKGQQLLDYVCEKLSLVEKDYFGLKFADSENERVSFSF